MPRYALCSEKITPDIKKELEKHGFTVVLLPPCPRLDFPVASHADMLCFRLSDGGLLIEKSTFEKISPLPPEIRVTTDCFGHDGKLSYPLDVRFNAAPLGKYVFCLEKHISPHIASDKGRNVVNVRQGYAGCSVCAVSDDAFITSDPTICEAGENQGFDVLKIRPGHVGIDGYDCGFIGGASGYCDGKVYFFGDHLLHPDGEAAERFIRAHGSVPVGLCGGGLFDHGGIRFI